MFASIDTLIVFPCLRFHFTTGKFPFEGDNVYKLFGAISTGVFEMPRDLSALLQGLLRGKAEEVRLEQYVGGLSDDMFHFVCTWGLLS